MAKEVTLKPKINIKPKNDEPLIDIEKIDTDPKRIRDTDANIHWSVIGMDDCEYTKTAVALIKDHGDKVTYQKINIDWQIKLSSTYDVRRLPAIFKGNTYFGGLGELENYYRATFFSASETFL